MKTKTPALDAISADVCYRRSLDSNGLSREQMGKVIGAYLRRTGHPPIVKSKLMSIPLDELEELFREAENEMRRNNWS